MTAGDFVHYINEGWGEGAELSHQYYALYVKSYSIQLDDERLIIFYGYGSSTYYLYA